MALILSYCTQLGFSFFVHPYQGRIYLCHLFGNHCRIGFGKPWLWRFMDIARRIYLCEGETDAVRRSNRGGCAFRNRQKIDALSVLKCSLYIGSARWEQTVAPRLCSGFVRQRLGSSVTKCVFVSSDSGQGEPRTTYLKFTLTDSANGSMTPE
jgi:hypothetical protein